MLDEVAQTRQIPQIPVWRLSNTRRAFPGRARPHAMQLVCWRCIFFGNATRAASPQPAPTNKFPQFVEPAWQSLKGDRMVRAMLGVIVLHAHLFLL
ncbi:hypothetical protein [Natronohydrobacter thiooxidans]|uniref:hypothetical protein n=1 Tax=Natronohydrobacter thiooxidans TaxID=87172 RepID=UPI001587A324|nr:hypothetical protein [Natronohydrobacter thiooxidans]